MPQYQFVLHPKGVGEPEREWVTADDDEEARALAELRLLMSRGVMAVTVDRPGMTAVDLRRDGALGGHAS